MRRARSSWRPIFASKRHFPFFSTIGTGIGQSSFPTTRIASFGSATSKVTSIFWRACSANFARLFLSATGSPDATMPLPSAPKMASTAAMSPASAALTRASAACCGVSKARGAAGGLAAWAGMAQNAHAIASEAESRKAR